MVNSKMMRKHTDRKPSAQTMADATALDNHLAKHHVIKPPPHNFGERRVDRSHREDDWHYGRL